MTAVGILEMTYQTDGNRKRILKFILWFSHHGEHSLAIVIIENVRKITSKLEIYRTIFQVIRTGFEEISDV